MITQLVCFSSYVYPNQTIRNLKAYSFIILWNTHTVFNKTYKLVYFAAPSFVLLYVYHMMANIYFIVCFMNWPYGLDNTGMSTHSQVIITAPYRHLGAQASRDGIVLSKRETLCKTVHRLKDTVGVVILLFHNLLSEEVIVVETGSGWVI